MHGQNHIKFQHASHVDKIYLLTAIGLTPGGSSTVQYSTVQYSTVQYTRKTNDECGRNRTRADHEPKAARHYNK